MLRLTYRPTCLWDAASSATFLPQRRRLTSSRSRTSSVPASRLNNNGRSHRSTALSRASHRAPAFRAIFRASNSLYGSDAIRRTQSAGGCWASAPLICRWPRAYSMPARKQARPNPRRDAHASIHHGSPAFRVRKRKYATRMCRRCVSPSSALFSIEGRVVLQRSLSSSTRMVYPR